MKNYTITVNGNVYDVTVEEKGAGAAPAARSCTGSSTSNSSSGGSTGTGSTDRSRRIY